MVSPEVVERPWIEWGGGKCPVKAGTAFEVQFRHGDRKKYRAKGHRPMDCCWAHASHLGRSDIVAYRVATPTRGISGDEHAG